MRSDPRIVFGLLLILAGVLFGLQELDLIGGGWEDPLFTLAYGLGFVFFLLSFLEDRSRWWAALAGFILLGLTLAQLSEMLLPGFAGAYGGAVFMGLMGLGFLAVYLIDRQMWWAIIPSGVMLSLTALIVANELPLALPFDSAGLLFFGMGLTFLVLYYLPAHREQLSWAIFPAIPLLVFGLFIGFGEADLWGYIWPALVIVLGLYFLIGSLRRA